MSKVTNNALQIDYEAVAFPANSSVTNGANILSVIWDDILWAALTIGRPNKAYVFAHGRSSYYEAIFRLSLIRLALEQASPKASRLRRTAAAKRLDPSEKGAISYFVGMTMAKLFAAKLLNAPWAVHVDVFGKSVGALLTQRSRPDLLAQIHGTNDWISIESKGRISPPDSTAKSRAKAQAQRIGIQGGMMRHHVGCITYLRRDVIQVYMEDPEPRGEEYAAVLQEDEAWALYYRPALSLASLDATLAREQPILAAADVSVQVHPQIESLLRDHKWAEVKAMCATLQKEFEAEGFQPDGLLVTAGQSWRSKFTDQME